MHNTRVALVFKDFSYWTGYSSTGLNVAAHIIAEVLNGHGIPTVVFGVKHNIELFKRITEAQHTCWPLTHVVIMAPWITPLDLQELVRHFSKINFTVQTHCNTGALHGDVRGMGNIRNYIDLTFDFPNLHIAGNSEPLVRWLRGAYAADAVLLPNMYPIKERPCPKAEPLTTLRIGAFGALRPEKNFVTAAAAALYMHAQMGMPTELHMSAGGEVDGKRLWEAINQMTQGVPGFTLKRHRWAPWQDFRRLVGKMDILLQPSYSESFNIVTADGITSGVPSVVSPAIAWAPESWKANPDDAVDIAEVGMLILGSRLLAQAGLVALERHNKKSLEHWKEYLLGRRSWLERLETFFSDVI